MRANIADELRLSILRHVSIRHLAMACCVDRGWRHFIRSEEGMRLGTWRLTMPGMHRAFDAWKHLHRQRLKPVVHNSWRRRVHSQDAPVICV